MAKYRQSTKLVRSLLLCLLRRSANICDSNCLPDKLKDVPTRQNCPSLSLLCRRGCTKNLRSVLSNPFFKISFPSCFSVLHFCVVYSLRIRCFVSTFHSYLKPTLKTHGLWICLNTINPGITAVLCIIINYTLYIHTHIHTNWISANRNPLLLFYRGQFVEHVLCHCTRPFSLMRTCNFHLLCRWNEDVFVPFLCLHWWCTQYNASTDLDPEGALWGPSQPGSQYELQWSTLQDKWDVMISLSFEGSVTSESKKRKKKIPSRLFISTSFFLPTQLSKSTL